MNTHRLLPGCGSAFVLGVLWNTILLRTTRMRSQLFGRVSGVAALVTNKQLNEFMPAHKHCELFLPARVSAIK
jgi:hypothetical protein